MAEMHASPPDPYQSPAAERQRTPQKTGSKGTASRRGGPLLIGVLVVVLLVLHQDYWFWRNDTLVFGWIPLGLFYHVCLSILASLVWILATKIAWPAETIRAAQLATPTPASSPTPAANPLHSTGPREESER